MNILRCPSQALSADFGDIIVGGISEKLFFNVIFGSEIILSETYFPDMDGVVHIRDMAPLAEIYREKTSLTPLGNTISGAITFTLQFIETETLTKSITLYACAAETAGTLTVAHLQAMPLTRCFGKFVCPGQKEYLSFYGSGNITLDIVCIGVSQDSFATFNYANLSANPSILCRIDVSPEAVAARAGIDPLQVVCYEVHKDNRAVAKFTMNKFLQPQKTFIFQNSFGASETFTCTGDEEKERKWTREYGQITRRQHLISRRLETINTIQSGYLTRGQTEILEDLLNAQQIALIDAYGWHPVTIVEESFKVVSRKDELINVEFKYRLAGDNHLQYRAEPYKYKIFDFTFDNSFN
jgi:hypothetical protein